MPETVDRADKERNVPFRWSIAQLWFSGSNKQKEGDEGDNPWRRGYAAAAYGNGQFNLCVRIRNSMQWEAVCSLFTTPHVVCCL